jgi:hypothetical protein
MPFILCLHRVCSCISKIFGLSQECKGNESNNDLLPDNERTVSGVFSFEPSLQESSMAAMSPLFMSEPSRESSYSLQSSKSLMIGYGTEFSETSSPDSADLGKNLSSIFNSSSDSSSVFGQERSADNSRNWSNLVTPVEDDMNNIVRIMQSNDENNEIASQLRPHNLNTTHFHEHSCTPVESITPSESSVANKGDSSKLNNSISSADAAPSGKDCTAKELIVVVVEKKKYPVTPYPKFEAFSSPTTVHRKKRVTKLPKSVITMRRGLVKTRVGHIQKKLDRQLQEHAEA